jgi:hypothetical protein
MHDREIISASPGKFFASRSANSAKSPASADLVRSNDDTGVRIGHAAL